MREPPRPGIAALCAAAGLEPRTISARALGFTLAPSINAAGRMTHPDRALELPLAPDRAAVDVAGVLRGGGGGGLSFEEDEELLNMLVMLEKKPLTPPLPELDAGGDAVGVADRVAGGGAGAMEETGGATGGASVSPFMAVDQPLASLAKAAGAGVSDGTLEIPASW